MKKKIHLKIHFSTEKKKRGGGGGGGGGGRGGGGGGGGWGEFDPPVLFSKLCFLKI